MIDGRISTFFTTNRKKADLGADKLRGTSKAAVDNGRQPSVYEYWEKGDQTPLGGLWIKTEVHRQTYKFICGERVYYYEISLPPGIEPETAAVEKWQVRKDVTYREIAQGLIKAGTRLELRVKAKIPYSDHVEGWAMVTVMEDSWEVGSLKVHFLNKEHWPDAVHPRSSFRISDDVASTDRAWNPEPTLPLISDVEPHIPKRLQMAAKRIKDDIAPQIGSLTPHTFEPFREELTEIAETLIIARRYEKAIVLIKFIKEVELAITRTHMHGPRRRTE